MGTIAQYLIFPIVWILSKIFFIQVVFDGEENFSYIVDKPAIIIANHISFYDSFLLRLSVYWKKFRVYFMGVRKFNSATLQFLNFIGLIPIVYYLFGVFTVTPGLGLDRNLDVFKRILSQNSAVFIFPEGSINTKTTLVPFKRGAAVLAIQTGVSVLPVGFYREKLGGRDKIKISIGNPMVFKQSDSVDEVNKQLQDSVAKLASKSWI